MTGKRASQKQKPRTPLSPTVANKQPKTFSTDTTTTIPLPDTKDANPFERRAVKKRAPRPPQKKYVSNAPDPVQLSLPVDGPRYLEPK